MNTSDFVTAPEINSNQKHINLLNYYYGTALTPLLFNTYTARMQKRDPEAIALAESLIEKAKAYDIQQTFKLITQPFNDNLQRDFDNPPEYTNPSIIGQAWADEAEKPLVWDEQWNKGRRITNVNIHYQLDQKGLPINPYLNYGVKGRGVVGRFGPNHAVDNGIISIRPNDKGEPTLHALGIIRNDNGKPALCGGFTEFHSPYDYSRSDMVRTQAHEFFEELVSGSVELLPDYAANVDNEVAETIRNRETAQGKTLSEKQINVIRNQITTHHKLQQVSQKDPTFLENIESMFETARDCYKGPVLDSERNTNTSWMETRLSWVMLDDKKWDEIKGFNKFNYDFKAGDDAQQVLWHEITPDLIKNATGSHNAFFTYLLSAYLLTEKHDDPAVLESVKQQAQTLNTYYDQALSTAVNRTLTP